MLRLWNRMVLISYRFPVPIALVLCNDSLLLQLLQEGSPRAPGSCCFCYCGGLLHNCDCYYSLHRSDNLGNRVISMAEDPRCLSVGEAFRRQLVMFVIAYQIVLFRCVITLPHVQVLIEGLHLPIVAYRYYCTISFRGWEKSTISS